MASDLHKVVEKAREASTGQQTSSFTGVVYRGSNHPYTCTLLLRDVEPRLLAGTLRDLFPDHCGLNDGVCFRRTSVNGSSTVNVGMPAALLMALTTGRSVTGTWSEEIFVGKPGSSASDLASAVAEGALPTIVCSLNVLG